MSIVVLQKLQVKSQNLRSYASIFKYLSFFIVSKNSLDYIETGYLENIRFFIERKGRI